MNYGYFWIFYSLIIINQYLLLIRILEEIFHFILTFIDDFFLYVI